MIAIITDTNIEKLDKNKNLEYDKGTTNNESSIKIILIFFV